MHKRRNLVKPMMAVTTNGFIYDAFGPYPASISDAEILKMLMKDKEFYNVFRPGDGFVVDRGFRDAVKIIEEKGFQAFMPDYIDKDKKQLTTEQANHSRLITKIRFIVEVINGRVKKTYHYFDNVWSNKAVPHVMEDFRIACAVYNAFMSKIESDKLHNIAIYNCMQSRIDNQNIVLEIVNEHKLIRKRSIFEKMNSDMLPDFPKLT